MPLKENNTLVFATMSDVIHLKMFIVHLLKQI